MRTRTPQQTQGSLTNSQYARVFGLRKVPKFKRPPLVLVTGTGLGKLLVKQKQVRVETIHGPAKLLVGEIRGARGLPVVVIPRHADPERSDVKAHLFPHQVNQPAYATVIAALNPRAVVTIHAMGVDGYSPGHKPGNIGVITKMQSNHALDDVTIYSKAVTKRLLRAGVLPGDVGHTPMPIKDRANPGLIEQIRTAAKLSGFKPVSGKSHSIRGPRYETDEEVEELIQEGVNYYGMTHQQEVVALMEARHAIGAGFPVASIAVLTNYALKGEHHEVKTTAEKMQPNFHEFLKKLAASL
jgi:purine nucleoside phosphorylase